MEGLRADSAAARFIAAALGPDRFTLVDVGCSGGADDVWDVFGERLQVYGFDASVTAIDQLQRDKAGDRFHYFAGLVGLPDDHPFHAASTMAEFDRRNPWARLAVARTQAVRDAAQGAVAPVEPVPAERPPAVEPPAATVEPSASTAEALLQHNLWNRTVLAEAKVHLPELFARECVADIDFIKIDIDGPDYEVLVSLDRVLEDAGVLGVGVEVNFIGSGHEGQPSFHNTDRFLRERGFELFNLTVRRYASAALPFIYADVYPFAHRAVGGRPFQGDALYVRDLGFAHEAQRAAALPDGKLLKLAALFALAGLADQAAEVLLQFRERLEPLLDIAHALDLLTREAHDTPFNAFTEEERARSYADYMAAFEADSPRAYGGDARLPAWIDGLVRRAEEADRDRRRASEEAEQARVDAERARVDADQAHGEIEAMRATASWRLMGWLRSLRRVFAPARQIS